MEDFIQSNQQLNIDALPTITQQSYVPLEPVYAKLKLASHATIMFVPLVVTTFILLFPLLNLTKVDHANLSTLSVCYAVFMSCFCVFRFFANRAKGYAIREFDISMRSGLLFQSIISQPILRIQHVEIERGPLERKYGLATLQVFSAGGSLYTFKLPGLNVKTAEKIRQFLLSHKDVQRNG